MFTLQQLQKLKQTLELYRGNMPISGFTELEKQIDQLLEDWSKYLADTNSIKFTQAPSLFDDD